MFSFSLFSTLYYICYNLVKRFNVSDFCRLNSFKNKLYFYFCYFFLKLSNLYYIYVFSVKHYKVSDFVH